ncbi:nuclear transport factor 2 family protein [Actinomadura roseirufa]|uniref:nuclear transport factor 2 family protein n=1 Tax=Actinomadura roseirufa TaxID=2094049 RepID=UPI0013F14CE7|nr:nuclear transport factor 2 family protein [Actinomadura roseirufa]
MSESEIDFITGPAPDPARAAITAAVGRYLEALAAQDMDALAAFYHPDAELIDPIGSPPVRGAAAIRAFYLRTRPAAVTEVTRVGEITVHGDHAAFQFRVVVEDSSGATITALVTEIMSFDSERRIRFMLAVPEISVDRT